MPTEYEDEPDDSDENNNENNNENDEPHESFFDEVPLEAQGRPIPPEQLREIMGRVRCSFHMHDVRAEQLNAIAEKWLDDYLIGCKDAAVPRSKEKMMQLLTEVVIPACQLFELHDDADLEKKVSPDRTTIEFLIDLVDGFFYGDDLGIRVKI